MSQTKNYASTIAKIGAERGKLLGEMKIRSLAETSLQDFTSQLRETTYQTQIAKLTLPITSRKLEHAFKENLIVTFEKIINFSPKKVKEYLNVYLLRFEIENIKTLIKSAISNLSYEQKTSRIYFSIEDYFRNRVVIEEAAKYSTIREVVNAFKKTEYESALSKGLQIYEKNRSTALFDILLDQLFYKKLYNNYQNLPKKEKSHAAFYVRFEIDGYILLTLLRGKVLNYDENSLRSLVPLEGFKITSGIVETLVKAIDFDAALNICLKSPYAKLFSKAQSPEEIIANAERALKTAMFNHAKTSIILEIFNIGAPLSFMTLKEAEVRNLVALSAGLEGDLGSEEIRSKLSI